MYSRCYRIISPLGRALPFIWTNLNPLHPRILCDKFGWNWPSGSGEEDENVKSLQTDRRRDRQTDRRTDDGRQVIRKGLLSFQLRWAKKQAYSPKVFTKAWTKHGANFIAELFENTCKNKVLLMIMLAHLIWMLSLFCFFVVYRPTRDFFTHIEMSPLPLKGCKFWAMIGTHGHWAVRVI